MKKSKMSFKLKNGFKVHIFLQILEADYLFSSTNREDFYRLLNVDELGHLSEDDVENLIDSGKRVLVINNDTLGMTVHNIPEEEVTTALMEMGR